MIALAAEFTAEARLVEAVTRLRGDGVARIETYTPYPVEAIDTLLPQPRKLLPALVFVGGMLGLAGGFLLQWYGAGVGYPLNIGGRPPASWAAFIPIAFEIAVLCAVAAGFGGFLALARLPMPYQPIQFLPGFDRATQDRFFLVIDTADPSFDADRVTGIIKECDPCRVTPWQH